MAKPGELWKSLWPSFCHFRRVAGFDEPQAFQLWPGSCDRGQQPHDRGHGGREGVYSVHASVDSLVQAILQGCVDAVLVPEGLHGRLQGDDLLRLLPWSCRESRTRTGRTGTDGIMVSEEHVPVVKLLQVGT